MRPLVLCQSCRRHVRVSETQCPFCSAALVALLAHGTASKELARGQGAASARGLPGGRAALFLAGTALAAGCGEEPEPDGLDEGRDAGAQHAAKDAGLLGSPVYGISIDRGMRDAGRQTGLGTVPYGISIDNWKPDASIVTPPDAGPSCPQVGNLPVPVYGIGIDARPRDMCRDAAKDAGLDAGADAGKDAGLDAGKDAGRDPLPVPPYGISIDSSR